MKIGKPERPWDMAAGILAALLILNFIVEAVLAVTMIGVILLHPAPGFVTAGLLLVGIIGYLAFKRKFSKLWRRFLLGGILCNLALVVFYILGIAALMAMWL